MQDASRRRPVFCAVGMKRKLNNNYSGWRIINNFVSRGNSIDRNVAITNFKANDENPSVDKICQIIVSSRILCFEVSTKKLKFKKETER